MDSARAEWRSYWHLPLLGALGMSVSVLHVYSLGPFMQPLAREFGWSRAQISSGITIANGMASLLSVFAGMAVDRFGPRRVGICGIAIMCTAIGSLGAATGSNADWVGHFVLVGLGCLSVHTTIWAGAVASRFRQARGLAISIAMCGSGISATIMPLAATWLIGSFGWRGGFVGLGFLWLAVAMPLIILFFSGAQDEGRGRRARPETAPIIPTITLPGLTVAQGLHCPAFYKLAVAGGMYSFVLIGTIVHFVPILEDRGRAPLAAAATAGLIGFASIIGRLGTGLLLDRFPGNRVGAAAFVLPTLGLALLQWSGSAFGEVAAAIVIGLSVGAELDVIAYLSTRHIGLRRFGALFGIMITALSAGLALGPVAAGTTFDHFGSYGWFLAAGMPLMAGCAIVLATLGRCPEFAPVEPASTVPPVT
ncbi:MFS transporter [uncultured Sphingomonas sp.]|uniref:MFS transporter n=1 Tax=uncultured Sphingomonas sp. TaxID=158754 RepID=UPI0035CBA021